MSIVCYVSLFERGDKRIRKIACSVAIRVECHSMKIEG